MAPHASAQDDSSNDRVLVTARLLNDVLTARRDDLVYSSRSDTGAGCRWPFESSWVRPTQVLLSCSGDNDANGGYVITNVPPRGSTRTLVEHHRGRFNQYVGLTAYSQTQALAVENQYCAIECPDHKAPESARAVRVDLRTGAVTDVLATALPGREVTAVLGGRDGVIYTTAPTSGRGPTRTYLRRADDPRGKIITGLKGDVEAAQP